MSSWSPRSMWKTISSNPMLFFGRIMNLYVIAALATSVTIETLVSAGDLGSRVTGALLIVLALWVSG
jgi:predicted metal-binding membrane protein